MIAIFAGTALAEARIKREWFKKLFNIAELTLTWFVVGWLFRLVYNTGTDYFGSPQNILAVVLAGLVAFILNSALGLARDQLCRPCSAHLCLGEKL